MAAAFYYLAAGHYTSARAALLGIGLGYVAISVSALLGRRWAVGICVLAAFLLMLRWLPMVLVNTWMFATGHALYRDSPATILVVLSYAVVFAIPATILSILYGVHRKRVWQALRHGTQRA